MDRDSIVGGSHAGCVDWRVDVRKASLAPDFKSFAMVRGGGFIVRGHPSKEGYLTALEDNAQAWGRLYCEGLMRGDVSLLAMRVSTLSYQMVGLFDALKSHSEPLLKTITAEERAEFIVKDWWARCINQ